MKKSVLALSLSLCAAGLVWAAQAPVIDAARVAAAMKQYETQMQQAGRPIDPKQQQQLQQDITKSLQGAEVLKAEALKAGLDKQDSVQSEWKNLEAQFYAQQYVNHLKSNVQVSDADLLKLYQHMGREIKLQQAAFPNAAEAEKALALLKKGMSFEQLTKQLKDQPQSPQDWINPQAFPPEIGQVINSMEKGQITGFPVAFGGAYYLFRLADVQQSKEMPPFAQIKPQLLEQAKEQQVQMQIQKILQEAGIQP